MNTQTSSEMLHSHVGQVVPCFSNACSDVTTTKTNKVTKEVAMQYEKDYKGMIRRLHNLYNSRFLEVFPPPIHNPYPLAITLSTMESMENVVQAMHRGILAIVQNYMSDPTLCEGYLPMDKKTMKILSDFYASSTEDRPLSKLYSDLGLWRPDVLFPSQGWHRPLNCDDSIHADFLVCEINGRYPLNAYYLSYETNKAVHTDGYTAACAGVEECKDPHEQRLPLLPVPRLKCIPHVLFQHRIGGNIGQYASTVERQDSPVDVINTYASGTASKFDHTKPIAILRRRGVKSWDSELFQESGVEVHLNDLQGQWCGDKADAGCDDHTLTTGCTSSLIRYVDPVHLVINPLDNCVYETGSSSSAAILPLSQFVLELDQQYICDNYSIGGDNAVVENGNDRMGVGVLYHILHSKECLCVNDIRTILIAHDKRLLAALTDSALMSRYLNHHDVALLQQFIVPTYLVADMGIGGGYCNSNNKKQLRDSVRAYPSNWMLKPNGGGKGIGIVFGVDCSVEEWCSLLDNDVHSQYVLQPYVQQQSFSVLCKTDATTYGVGVDFVPMTVVGLLHCAGDQFLGPGVFRASPSLSLSPTDCDTRQSRIVNLSGGNGIIIPPALFPSRLPLSTVVHSTGKGGLAGTASGMWTLPDCCCFQALSSMEPNSLWNEHQLLDVLKSLDDFGVACVQIQAYRKQKVGVGEVDQVDEVAEGRNGGCAGNDINQILIDFVHQLGGVVHLHDDSGEASSGVWDVRPIMRTPTRSILSPDIPVVPSECTSLTGGIPPDHDHATLPARSHTAEEFPLHTDCCFEEPSPRYMLLYVVRESCDSVGVDTDAATNMVATDGDGLTLLVDTSILPHVLSTDTMDVLLNTDFRFRVPLEFRKNNGRSYILGRICRYESCRSNEQSDTQVRLLWRYRSDVVLREHCSKAQVSALHELDCVLQQQSKQQPASESGGGCSKDMLNNIVFRTKLQQGSLLLLDNARWLHGRTAIRDCNRWLKRIRFNIPETTEERHQCRKHDCDSISAEDVLEVNYSETSGKKDYRGEKLSSVVSGVVNGTAVSVNLLDGVFARLKCCSMLLRLPWPSASTAGSASDGSKSGVSDPIRRSGLSQLYYAYVRNQLKYVESLDLFMMDLPPPPPRGGQDSDDQVAGCGSEWRDEADNVLLFKHAPLEEVITIMVPAFVHRATAMNSVHAASTQEEMEEMKVVWSWVVIQLSNAVLVQNNTQFVLSVEEGVNGEDVVASYEYLCSLVSCPGVVFVLRTLTGMTSSGVWRDGNKTCVSSNQTAGPNYCYKVGSSVLTHGGQVLMQSVVPSLTQLTQRMYHKNSYLQQKYFSNDSSNTDDPAQSEGRPVQYVARYMDEFDVLSDAQRMKFVQERLTFVVGEATLDSAYYHPYRNCYESMCEADYQVDNNLPFRTDSLEVLRVLPLMTGDMLRSATDSKALLGKGSQFSVCFGTGGTTGEMKNCYRTQWEDDENARYLGKGLLAGGICPGDIVVNCLGAGFWGGCCVVPVGKGMPMDQLVVLLQRLRPTTILATPTWLLSFSQYLDALSAPTHPHPCVHSVRAVITGGEVLFSAARNKIALSLGIDCCRGFLSTGYTSNETGAIGFQCTHSLVNDAGDGEWQFAFHLHENMQHLDMQVVDEVCGSELTSGSGCMKGAEGAVDVYDGVIAPIVATNLNRTYMPMMRYCTGDVGSWVTSTNRLKVTNSRCGCGRSLKRFLLHGRSDTTWARLAGGDADIKLESLAGAVGAMPELSSIFSLHISKSTRHLDVLCISVELAVMEEGDTNTGIVSGPLMDVLERQLLCEVSTWCPDFKPSLWDERENTGVCEMEVPTVVFYNPGYLPRNDRTGKVSLVVDTRGLL